MTLLILFANNSSANTGPGGGGYGAVMSDAFFQRYEPRYQVSDRWKHMKRVKPK